MNRETLSSDRIEPEALKKIAGYHSSVVKEVQDAVTANKVVVVGMAQNPFVKKVRKALDDAKIQYKYLEYGSYFSSWRPRLAIKLWSGWSTYPQVFVNGKLVGGFTETQTLLTQGKIS